MKIWKALNNNVAVVLDEKGQEKIVMGKGICFKKGAGDSISDDSIDKTFSLSGAEANSKFQVLIQDVPMEHIALGEEIIAEAKTRLGNKMNDMIYISLIDHVHTSIVRCQDGITVKNMLLWDIRRFYREEYQVGLWALALIRERFGVALPEDEAGYIAMHIISISVDQNAAYDVLKFVKAALDIIKQTYGIALDHESIDAMRLITHLKFLAQRMFQNHSWEDEGMENMYEMLLDRHPQNRLCLERLDGYCQNAFGYTLNLQEKFYLLVHLTKIF